MTHIAPQPEGVNTPPTPPGQIKIVVSYADHQTGFFPVPSGEGWRVDPALRCIVIGRGVPRTLVPLDGVQCFHVEES
jgi:hypothetical protein